MGKDGQAATSAYAIGLFSRGAQQFLFGASVVLRMQQQGSRWLLAGARIQVNWCKGDAALAAHWRQPPSDAGWQLGDPTPEVPWGPPPEPPVDSVAEVRVDAGLRLG